MPTDSTTYTVIDGFESSDVIAHTKNIASDFVICTNCSTFTSTVSVLHTIRTASGSFFKKVFATKDNTPSMPLPEAHLEGFFILA